MQIKPRIEHWCSHNQHVDWARREDILLLIQCSEYAAKQLKRDTSIIKNLLDQANTPLDWVNFNFTDALSKIAQCLDEATLMRELRIHKHHYQTALIYAVVCQHLPQTDFLLALSELATALVSIALQWQEKALQKRYGTPYDEDGKPLSMSVFAMGKLGGKELNFSSDIDLIFAYRNNGETRTLGKQKPQEHEVYFRKLAQKLIHVLDQVSEDGFVYRVDMRLRPFGQTGPLALSYSAMETYYQLHGRNWERYAMMKARPIAGDIEGGYALLQELRPFIYRRYLDYNALSAIADMKQSINQQIRTTGMENHIKLGRGGIREAEFSVQAIQLIYGGQYPKLQSPHFLNALEDLSALQLWHKKDTKNLRQAYLLLRSVENALQFDIEKQTHRLPDTEYAWQRLALATHFSTPEELKTALKQAREIIHERFTRIFNHFKSPCSNHNSTLHNINWQQPDTQTLKQSICQLGYSLENSYTISDVLNTFSQNIPWEKLPTKTVSALKRLIVTLLETAAQSEANSHQIAELLTLIERIANRGVYINMMSDEPKLLGHLIDIARNSIWLMQFICEHPLVLDDILSERTHINDSQQLEADLNARLQGLDEENWLNAIRDFKHAQVFKIAWAEIHDKLHLMRASDQLTHLAELILKKTYEKAHHILSHRHGIPRCTNGSPARFSIIAYGKLGGLELGYDSDLDLVFLYDDNRSQGYTDGEKSIANQMFFTRLTQRINNTLSTPSSSGVLYDVDTRLRPGGKSGMLVTSIDAFAEYQYKHAWTWEHQAITRARAIGGDPSLCADFENLRKKILRRPPVATLRDDVISMRQKMLDNDTTLKNNLFHLKKSRGGLIDIEFIVQYLLLNHAHQEDIIIRMSDNIRQLASLEATGILNSMDAMTLRDTYRKLRQHTHRQNLNKQKNIVSYGDWQASAEEIVRIWQHFFEPDS